VSFEELAGRRICRQHCLDQVAKVHVLATPLGEVRGSLLGREFPGGVEDFLIAISICAHETKVLLEGVPKVIW